MSAADDKSLLAMKSARMSVGSIAFTMGWSEKRVERRLGELAALNEPRLPRPAPPAERAPPANPVRTPPPGPPLRPAPRQSGQDGLVTRTFRLSDGGLGAAVLLEDARLVFTETGRSRPDLNAHIPVAQASGCFRMLKEQADG